jgi:hypothetical protein
MTAFYLEQRSLDRWTPVRLAAEPVTVTRNGKTLLISGSGHQPQVRAVSKIIPVHEALPLANLARIYGLEGDAYDPAFIAEVNR